MKEPFRITEVSAQGVKMNRLPVTPAEEAQVRSALAQAKDMLAQKAPEEIINEQQPVYPSGYRLNCAPRDRIPGGPNPAKPGIQVEQQSIRRMEHKGQGKRAESGKAAGWGHMAVQSSGGPAEGGK